MKELQSFPRCGLVLMTRLRNLRSGDRRQCMVDCADEANECFRGCIQGEHLRIREPFKDGTTTVFKSVVNKMKRRPEGRLVMNL